LSRAHIILIPAVRDGLGLIVTEANAMGTPTIGYNVHGLRDSIRRDETGITISERSPGARPNRQFCCLEIHTAFSNIVLMRLDSQSNLAKIKPQVPFTKFLIINLN
jgi:glycosyltransferase involved in cell wall biosynthesis